MLVFYLPSGVLMDLGKYIKKSSVNNLPAVKKVCLECGKEVDKEHAGHLYYHSFCSQACKEKYVGMALD